MAKMYFLALVAPDEINKQVLKWKTLMKERFDCMVALRSPAHITLIPPFWMDETLEARLQKKMNKFSKTVTPFEIFLNNFGSFKPRVIFVDVSSNLNLLQLHHQLIDSFIEEVRFPIETDERPFHPHVTIATRDLQKKSFREAWEIFKEKRYRASWLANGISLLRHNQKNWDVIFTSQFSN